MQLLKLVLFNVMNAGSTNIVIMIQSNSFYSVLYYCLKL